MFRDKKSPISPMAVTKTCASSMVQGVEASNNDEKGYPFPHPAHFFLCFLLVFGSYRWLLLAGADFFGVPDGSPKHFTIVFNAFVFCQVSSPPRPRPLRGLGSVQAACLPTRNGQRAIRREKTIFFL